MQYPKDVDELFSTKAVRERSRQIWDYVANGQSRYFVLHPDKIDACVAYVAEEIKNNYPRLDVPYHSRWRHFDVGGFDRVAWLDAGCKFADTTERARALYDLVITSVLLDAGAGAQWCYSEEKTKQTFSRSEGLAVASYYLFISGAFACDKHDPLKAYGEKLANLPVGVLEKAFQVSEKNPLVGTQGRANLLNKLGVAVLENPTVFGKDTPRLGNLVDYLLKQSQGKKLNATVILKTILTTFNNIWPGRVTYHGVNLGDTWRHAAVKGNGDSKGLVPFHKLSQWLTYSLFEPLEDLGIEITNINQLTGLPEYRNGGLFVDLGVLTLKDPALFHEAHKPDSELIVEWRALTVCLLDTLGERVAGHFGLNNKNFPLAKVLQGGTWSAGRKIAAAKRPGGEPPISLVSDGTVF